MIRELLRGPLTRFALWSMRAAPSGTQSLPGFADWMIGQAHALPDEAFAYPEAFKLLPDVYACISLIQESIAALPLKFYAGDIEIERKPGNVVDLWMRANPRDTGNMLVQQIAGSLDINGNAYLFIERLGSKQARELWCLPPHHTQPIAGPRRSIAGYEFDNGTGRPVRIPPEQMVMFRRYDVEHGILGMSPLSAAMMRVLTQRDSQRWTRHAYKSGGVIAGFFSTEVGLMDPDIKRLQEQMKQRYGSPESAGKPVILPRGLKFERQALTMAELQFIETAKLTSSDIYRIFHVPPVIMGMKEGGGLSDAGADTDLLLFYENCIGPRCEIIQSVLNEDLLSTGEFGPNVTCEFDLSGVMPLQRAFLDQAKALVEITGGPVMTRNEARAILDLPELDEPELDELLLPASMAPAQEPDDEMDMPDDEPVGGATEQPVPEQGVTEDSAKHRSAHYMNDARTRDAYRVKASVRMQMHERRGQRMARRLFRAWERRAKKALALLIEGRAARVSPINVEDLLRVENIDRTLVSRFLVAVVEDGGTFAISELALDLAFDLRSASSAEFLLRRSRLLLDSTMRTTWDELRTSLAEGVVAGEDLRALMARVSEVMGGRIRSSAATIARTESVSAFNFGNFEAFRQVGRDVVPRFAWLTAQDERVREGHAEAEGQEVEVGHPFVVRASALDPFEELLFPGDPMGSAGNCINCRCCLMPVVDMGAPDAADSDIERLLLQRGKGVSLSHTNGGGR